jgi:hypothetical protein
MCYDNYKRETPQDATRKELLRLRARIQAIVPESTVEVTVDGTPVEEYQPA